MSNRDPRTVAVLDAVEAAVACSAGELSGAERLAASALTGLGGLAAFAPTIDPRITLASVALRRGDAAGAETALAAALEDAGLIGAVNRLAEIAVIRAGVALATDRYRRALGVFAETPETLDVRLAPDLRERIQSLQVMCHLRLGDPGPMRRLQAANRDPYLRAALAVADGDPNQLRLAVDLWPRSENAGDQAAWLALRAHHLHLTGERSAANRSLRELVGLIESSGHLQPILDLGIDLAALADEVGSASGDDELVEFAAGLDRGSRIVASLSERELQVLEGIAGFIPDEELARRMGITVNTLKTFHRRVFRKLKVNSRGEAVRRAEDAGILAPRPSRFSAHRRS